MKYFRTYPWGLQLLLLILMIFTMGSFGYFMVLSFLPKFTPYSLIQIATIDEHSPAALVKVGVIMQGIMSLFIFLIPAFVFAHLTHPSPRQYLGLRVPGKKIQPLLAVTLMLGAMPMLQLLEHLVGMINFGAKLKAEQAASESMMKAYLTMPDLATFITGFIVMAIIPAVGEELFFRGVLLKFAKKRSRGITAPIIFTAVFFAWSHSNIYGLFSIFLAGVLLAVVYNLTGSLWCSIVAHLFFNGTQVVLSYLGNTNSTVKTFLNNETVPYYYVLAGAIIFGASLYLLIKNKTPLPPTWTDDFPPGTPKDGEWDFFSKQ